MRDIAGKVANDFGRVRKTLDEYASDIDRQIKVEVEDVNNILQRIAKINREIMSFESSGTQGPDLRDKRDSAMRELAKYFQIRTYIDGKGHYNIMAENVGSLVIGGIYQKLSTSFRTQEGRDAQAPGEMNIYHGD